MEKEEANYNLIDWWKKVVFKNYANFNGRARRAEYWYFTLGNFILLIPFYALAVIGAINNSIILSLLGSAANGLFAFAILIPSLAVIVRRLHDINKSGWNYFIVLIRSLVPLFCWYGFLLMETGSLTNMEMIQKMQFQQNLTLNKSRLSIEQCI